MRVSHTHVACVVCRTRFSRCLHAHALDYCYIRRSNHCFQALESTSVLRSGHEDRQVSVLVGTHLCAEVCACWLRAPGPGSECVWVCGGVGGIVFMLVLVERASVCGCDLGGAG